MAEPLDGWLLHEKEQRRAWLLLSYRQRLEWLWQAKQFAARCRDAVRRRAPHAAAPAPLKKP